MRLVQRELARDSWFAPAMFCKFGKLRPGSPRRVATLICVTNLRLAFRSEAVERSDRNKVDRRARRLLKRYFE